MIKTEVKNLEKSEVEIKITVPWKEWKGFVEKASAEISQDVKVKGFRPGKAPKNMVEQKVGKAPILESAAQKTIHKTYLEAIEREKIDAIGSPQVEILKMAEGNDLEYRAKTAVMPEITLKPWQKEIRKLNKKNKGMKVEITDDEIAKELEQVANSRVKLVTVNREAKKGDSVELDFQVSRAGVPIENGTSKKHPMVLGTGAFIPGFEDNIVGMKEKEEKEFELKFPDKYHEKTLAGKPATFKVKLNLVQKRQTPEINDDFAKSLGKFKDLEDLKKNIKEGLTKEKTEKEKDQKRVELMDKMIELTEVELPETLIHSEIHRMIEEFKVQIQGMGMDLDTYLEKMKKKKDDLEKEWEPQAIKRIKASFILEQVAKDIEIKVPSEDIEKEMNKTLQQHKNIEGVEKNIDTQKLYNHTKEVMQNQEVFKYLENLS